MVCHKLYATGSIGTPRFGSRWANFDGTRRQRAHLTRLTGGNIEIVYNKTIIRSSPMCPSLSIHSASVKRETSGNVKPLLAFPLSPSWGECQCKLPGLIGFKHVSDSAQFCRFSCLRNNNNLCASFYFILIWSVLDLALYLHEVSWLSLAGARLWSTHITDATDVSKTFSLSHEQQPSSDDYNNPTPIAS